MFFQRFVTDFLIVRDQAAFNNFIVEFQLEAACIAVPEMFYQTGQV